MKRELSLVGALSGLAAVGCSGTPAVPEHPTWADVAPIMHGECSACHGSSAVTTGGGYRLDFFDMTPAVCGAAAQALNGFGLYAGSSADKIREDVTIPAAGGRPRMPPAPGPELESWERTMLQRWTAEPSKGPPPAGNRAPIIQVGHLPASADAKLAFTAVVEDPDGEPAIGVLEIGNVLFAMSRSGSFSVSLDTSKWPAGVQRLKATLCDGWQSASYDLGPVEIRHK